MFDKRALRKIHFEDPNMQVNDFLYFTTASVNRERLLIFCYYQNSARKFIGYFSRREKDMLILNLENNRWYKNIQEPMSDKETAHINTKAARKYLGIVDEKENVLKYLHCMVRKERYSKSAKKSEKYKEKANKLIETVLRKFPKRAYSFGKSLLGNVLLYSGKKVYCTNCKTWHTFLKKPKNGEDCVCPSCKKHFMAKPLYTSLQKDKVAFYVMLKHKGLLFILHCRYSWYMVKTTNEISDDVFPFWIDIFDPRKNTLKKFRYDFSGGYERGRGMRFSLYQNDYRYEPAPLYMGNIKNVIKDTALENSGLENLDDVIYLDKLLLLISRYPKEFEFLTKGRYKNLLLECIDYPQTLKKIKMLPRNIFTLDKELWYCDYEAIYLSNGKITPEDCKKIPRENQLRELVECVNMTNSTGSKIISYVQEKKVDLYYYRDYLKAVCDVIEQATVPKKLKFPSDLSKAHNNYVSRRKLKLDEKRNKEMKEKMKEYPQKIHFNNYDFYFATSYKFLIDEGLALNHCVGSTTYCDKVINGNSLIISMRAEPKKPLYTIEVCLAKNKPPVIHQMRGNLNSAPTPNERNIAEMFVRKELIKFTA